MGGDEASVPAAAFGGVYLRARSLGLRTSVHAGEWAGPDSVREVLDALRPDRLDHGIAAAQDPRLLERLAEEEHDPLRRADEQPADAAPSRAPRRIRCAGCSTAGVRVTLSADDPSSSGRRRGASTGSPRTARA